MLVDVWMSGAGWRQGRVVGEEPVPGQHAEARQSVAQEVEGRRREAERGSQLEGKAERREVVVGVIQVITGVTAVQFIVGDIRHLLLDCDWRGRTNILNIILVLIIYQVGDGEGLLLGLFSFRVYDRRTGRQRLGLTGW